MNDANEILNRFLWYCREGDLAALETFVHLVSADEIRGCHCIAAACAAGRFDVVRWLFREWWLNNTDLQVNGNYDFVVKYAMRFPVRTSISSVR